MGNAGGKVDKTKLNGVQRAAVDGSVREMERVLSKTPSTIETMDADGRLPIHWAALGGNLDVLMYLAARGSSVAAPDDVAGSCPLHIAVSVGHVGMVEWLLNFPHHDAGDEGDVVFDVNALDWDHQSALHFAAYSGSNLMVELLLAAGASLELPDREGRTPLMWAVYNGHLECVQFLAAAGGNLNATDTFGRSAAIYAAHRGHADILRDLIARGADIMLTDAQDQRPIDHALFSDAQDCIAILAPLQAPSTQGLDTIDPNHHHIHRKGNGKGKGKGKGKRKGKRKGKEEADDSSSSSSSSASSASSASSSSCAAQGHGGSGKRREKRMLEEARAEIERLSAELAVARKSTPGSHGEEEGGSVAGSTGLGPNKLMKQRLVDLTVEARELSQALDRERQARRAAEQRVQELEEVIVYAKEHGNDPSLVDMSEFLGVTVDENGLERYLNLAYDHHMFDVVGGGGGGDTDGVQRPKQAWL